MKAVLFSLMVLGFAMLVGAQTVAPSVDMHADLLTKDGPTTRLRGNAALAIRGPVWVIADEADLNETTNEIELRGNVRIRTSDR
jgi:hypothetical protein